MAQAAIQLQNVKKVIGKKTIIHGLTFDIYPGEVFGFLGPNGAGKTTTIRMIVGLMTMTEGDIFIFGSSIKNNFKDAIKHVGAIVENPELYKHLSGYRNLVHYARMMDGVGAERINEVIQLVGLQNRIHEKVKTYSLGMRQRLGLAQALLHNPSILILDEPTNGLDPAGIREMREHIRKLAREEGLAVIVSSHLLSEMELMCDRIGILQQGKLIGVQTVGDFVADDKEVMVRFTVEPTDTAFNLFKKMYGREPKRKGHVLQLPMEHEAIPAAAAALIKENVKLYGIQTASKTLEEKFLEVTGGKEIV
ncbi:ABC transporter ATP-binding protein [Camelliibacillus cellulosilyticus]|uniref:ABC transporter ATP-binding protein n=1 Tax=Camelliibacillus cellulosilyticus TaxID=2174486 RepID=A0ABV9GG82_9BACL